MTNQPAEPLARPSVLSFIVSRTATFALYVFAIIGGSNWDSDPDSWIKTAIHVIGAASFLWWAVSRTVRHAQEDEEHAGG